MLPVLLRRSWRRRPGARVVGGHCPDNRARAPTSRHSLASLLSYTRRSRGLPRAAAFPPATFPACSHIHSVSAQMSPSCRSPPGLHQLNRAQLTCEVRADMPPPQLPVAHTVSLLGQCPRPQGTTSPGFHFLPGMASGQWLMWDLKAPPLCLSLGVLKGHPNPSPQGELRSHLLSVPSPTLLACLQVSGE